MEADEFVGRILTVNGRDLTRINVARCQGRGGVEAACRYSGKVFCREWKSEKRSVGEVWEKCEKMGEKWVKMVKRVGGF